MPLSENLKQSSRGAKAQLLDRMRSAKGARAATVPHPREAEFLALPDEEVMYGGAVGGGKTEALLLWLLEGVQYPNYSGLFLRRTFAQLAGSPTSPIERSHRMFTGGCAFRNTNKVWRWPNGAMIRFGHMQHETDKHNYDGPEFHRIGFDQVEQFSETQYTYMFSRLRRTVGFPLTCGMRSSSNPVGGHWVKHRFVSKRAMETLKGFTAFDPSPPGMVFECPNTAGKFMPSRIADNPSLEVDEYIERLRGRLGATLAAKLANGDWTAVEGAVIDADDLRYYSTAPGGRPIVGPDIIATTRRFATIDTAGTSKQKAAELRGTSPSWSVCAIWDHGPPGLFLRYVWRERVGWPALKNEIAAVLRLWGNPLALIENAHHGQVLAAELGHSRLVSTTIPGMKAKGIGEATSAKYDRAVASGLLALVSQHRLWLPDSGKVDGAAGWMPEFESELLGWSGHPEETADQIDVCSYAADHVRNAATSWGGVIKTSSSGRARW
jgi:hypothetical protein